MIDFVAFASQSKDPIFNTVSLKRSIMTNEIAAFQVRLRNHLPDFAKHQRVLSDSSRTQSFMSWIRCSNLLNRVHLLLISSSRSDHCGRWLCRSSWPTINANPARKRRSSHLLVLSKEQRNWKGADVTRAPLTCCFLLAHAQLLTNDYRSIFLSVPFSIGEFWFFGLYFAVPALYSWQELKVR